MQKNRDEKPKKNDPPVKPEKEIPVKPDPDPDPTKKPEKNDPTRIDEPPPIKPDPQKQDNTSSELVELSVTDIKLNQ